MKMEFIPVKTRVVQPPQDEIWDIVDSLEVKDGDIIFITSKILGVHQGRTAKVGEIDKVELIKQEAEYVLPAEKQTGAYRVNLSITDNILIAAAGIDESNADGHYIMWPKNVDELCREIRERVVARTGVERLGVVATDSHTTPLRWGVVGMTIGLSGVEPLRNEIGEEDIFGREMQMTKVNVIDPLASMAVLLMGETDEQTPIVILRDFAGVEFDENGSMRDFKIAPNEDIYKPLLDVLRTKKEENDNF